MLSTDPCTGENGEALLDNDRVLVRRHVVPSGVSFVPPAPAPCGLLLVYIRGGSVAGSDDRVTIWRDGRVRWFGGTDDVEPQRNVGHADIELVSIVLKPLPVDAPWPADPVRPLGYPNIPGEDIFDNEDLIVQRFVIEPGQWEGVHAHQPNMLYVHVTGAHWAARSYTHAETAWAEPSSPGSVGWMEPIGLDAGHESGNAGTTPIDLLWVSLRR
jgi:hypothetical protein